MAGYRQITFRLPAEREDDFAAWLTVLGSLGCSVERTRDAAEKAGVRVTAYFPESIPDAEADLSDGQLETWDAVRETCGRVDDADWLAPYRAASTPFDVGRAFRIDPGEPDDPEKAAAGGALGGRHLLRIPARTAFGTGSHESTRLCVLWLEDLAARDDFAECRVFDVGTGSGILAFCAERLGARQVAGFDVDRAAVRVARDNARRNDCSPALWAGGIDSLSASARFELVLVNVLPERILYAYPALVEHLAAGGRVISSGNLEERREELLCRFAELGLVLEGEKSEGEWTSFLLRVGRSETS